jgi:hypothetical protein
MSLRGLPNSDEMTLTENARIKLKRIYPNL